MGTRLSQNPAAQSGALNGARPTPCGRSPAPPLGGGDPVMGPTSLLKVGPAGLLTKLSPIFQITFLPAHGRSLTDNCHCHIRTRPHAHIVKRTSRQHLARRPALASSFIPLLIVTLGATTTSIISSISSIITTHLLLLHQHHRRGSERKLS